MASPVRVVANPLAGRGRVGRELGRLTALLRSSGVDHAVDVTDRAGHATELAAAAAMEGAGTVVAVGGDGTVNEVVNGLMTIPPEARPAMGVVPAGSGADFARTFGLPKSIGSSLAGVVGSNLAIDIGRVRLDGSAAARYFANIANVGIAAETVARAERLPRWFGKSRYLAAFWPVLVRYRPEEMTLATDAEEVTLTAHNLLVANARYAGGGMLFSPHSDPGDGRLDAQMNIGPKHQAFTLMPRIYRGSHLPNRRIHQGSGSLIRLTTRTPQQVEADGEIVGTATEVTFDLEPGAIRLVV